MENWLAIILLLCLIGCKAPNDKSTESRLQGKWVVDQVIDTDSSSLNSDALPDYDSAGQINGSLFYKAKELKSTIELLDSNSLRTTLVFTNFGTPTWTTNNQTDSLILKLTNVTEESLVADGTVSSKGELFLYEGAIKFLDIDTIEWTLSDGRIFKLKRENKP